MSYRKILILSLAAMLVLSASLVSTLLTPIPPARATGGLASVSSVQLDAQSASQTDTAVVGTLTTAATFRVGAVVSGGANPSPSQALSTDTLFKFCVFITTTVPPGCSTTAIVSAAVAIVIRDVNNDGVYQTGEPVVAGDRKSVV